MDPTVFRQKTGSIMKSAVEAQNPTQTTVNQIDHHNYTDQLSPKVSGIQECTHKRGAPDIGIWESSETDNSGNPKQSCDGNDVQSPSKDDTSVECPVV